MNDKGGNVKYKWLWQLAIYWEGINRFTIKCKSIPDALRECEKMLDIVIGHSKLQTITIRRIIHEKR